MLNALSDSLVFDAAWKLNLVFYILTCLSMPHPALSTTSSENQTRPISSPDTFSFADIQDGEIFWILPEQVYDSNIAKIDREVKKTKNRMSTL